MKTARDRLRFQRLIAMVVTASCVPGVAPGETIALIPGATVHLAPGVAIELVPGVPIERDLAGGETHEYQLTLTAGQYAHAVADQLGIDLQLAVFAPDGKTLISINNVADTVGPEPVSILAETGGVYRLEVSPASRETPPGRYRVRVDELRAARVDDHTRMEAQELFADARKLEHQGTAESRRQSLEKYEAALSLWQVVSDRWHEALTLNRIGSINGMGKPDLALKQFQQALTLWRNLGDLRGEAQSLNDVGAIYGILGDARRALEYLRQALPLIRTLADRSGEVMILTNIGIYHANLGQYQEALHDYGESLELSRAIGDRWGEAFSLHGIGYTHASLGKNQTALQQLGRALEIAQGIGDRRLPPTILTMLGRIYARLGDFPKAMQSYMQALRLSREAANVAAESNTLRGIGLVYRMMGDPRKALEYLGQALPISQASQRGPVEASIRSEMGAAYADLGDKSKALSYYAQALELHQRAGTVAGQVIVLNQAGLLYEDTGQTEKAAESLDKALTLSRSIRYKPGEALALWGHARLARNRGRFSDARADLEAALSIVESTRTDLDSQDLRASFFASTRKYYDSYIDVLMRLHETGGAFEASERARARSLLESLVEVHADIRQGSDPALLERERVLQQQINVAEGRRLQLLARKDRVEQAAAVEEELTALLSDYQAAQTRIRTTSPHYAALMQPQSLSLKDIQGQVLDEETLLLEYALGEDRSYVWAVTPASIDSFELPGRAAIETAATRAYELLKGGPTREFQRQTELALAGLSQMLLGPVAGRLGRKRLVIVSDGALQYLPFEALPEPSEPTRPTRQPLVVDHEIVSLPSASVLAVLRRELAGRQPAAKAVAVFSDPVFEPDDPRVRRTPRQTPPVAPGDNQNEGGRTELTRSATESGVARFERLPFSRQEAESIERLAAPEGVLKAVDFSASKATATSADISQFRIVHLATHGLINSEHPELSGIVLSLVDEQGQPQDGFLRAHEIYNLRLGAELVVLSGCQTALGKDVKGEGLLSLTRGFMYAGAPRLVASLWDVKDRAAAELMRRFYERMLKDHLRPASALQAAQVSMWQEPQWRAPYYWAAFVIQGEWR